MCLHPVCGFLVFLLLLNLTDQTPLSPLPFFSLASPSIVSLIDLFCDFSEVTSPQFLHKRIGEWEGREANVQVEKCLELS